MSILESIRNKLEKELLPNLLDIKDETEKHAGHHHILPGAKETHVRIRVTSPKFANIKLIDAHKMIYKVLEVEMKKIHALSIEVK